MTPTPLVKALVDALIVADDAGSNRDDWEYVDRMAGALLALPPDRRAAIAAELLDVDALAPHPNEQHEFRTTCLRCGERGTLHISLIGSDEVVTIAPPSGAQT